MMKRCSNYGVLILSGWVLIGIAVSPASGEDVTAPTAVAVSVVPKSPVFPDFNLANALVEEQITAKELLEIEKGEVIVRARPVPKGNKGTHVVAIGLISGTTQQVFDVVMDCDGQPKFVPHLESCSNSYAPGVVPATATQYEQTQKLKFGFGFVSKTIQYTISMFAIRPYVSGWVLKKGDVDQSEGYWRVIPHKNGKQILVYDVYSNPGMAVPDWVQEILVKSDLPNTVKAFRDRVQSQNKDKSAK